MLSFLLLSLFIFIYILVVSKAVTVGLVGGGVGVVVQRSRVWMSDCP